ncbi:uncharacterized protein [Amphiura filiformis]|uniref:uncharacterized protein n=1 Tax=Amphiura filiformis TaxID=82378 RepID=UPI003B217C5E
MDLFILAAILLAPVCSSAPMYEDTCLPGCNCTTTDDTTTMTLIVFDTIDCNATFLSSNSSIPLPPVKHLFIDCGTQIKSLQFQEFLKQLYNPSILETLSFASCNVTTTKAITSSQLSPFTKLKTLQISDGILSGFDPFIFNYLCVLESIDLANNIGLDSWIRNASTSTPMTNTDRTTAAWETTTTKSHTATNPFNMSPTSETPVTTKPDEVSQKQPTSSTAMSPLTIWSSEGQQSSILSTKSSPTTGRMSPSSTLMSTALPISTSIPNPSMAYGCSSYNITHLDLSGNDLKTLDLSPFPFVHGIKELNLENNNLSDLAKTSLHDIGLVAIETISLAYNNISDISSAFFEYLPSLSFITLSHNAITDAFLNFTGSPTVRVLDLSCNQISHLSVEFFEELAAIEELNLSHNLMYAITATTEYYTFSWCPHIRIVDLSFNLLQQIEEALFQGLKQLETVNLSNNRLISIPENTFDGVEKLQSLNLANNLLSNFQTFHFNAQTGYVVNVSMSGNPLDCDCYMGNLLTGQFDKDLINWPYSHNFANQRFLDQSSLVCNKTHGPIPNWQWPVISFNDFYCDYKYPSHCPINCSCWELTNHVIATLLGTSEFVTDCDWRNITNIPTDIYAGSSGLELQDNKLNRIPAYSFIELVDLKTLDLYANNISEIEDEGFAGLRNLTRLDLRFNKLHTIKKSYFKHLISLVELDLRNNTISNIEQGSFKYLVRLEKLYLNYNRLKHLPDPFLYANQLTILELGANDLHELPLVLVAQAPTRYDKDYTVYPNTEPTILLTYNKLKTIPQGWLNSPFMAKTWKRIDLGHNQITSLPKDIFETVRSQLEILYLHNNSLTTLPDGIFNNFPYDVTILLDGNPWNCNCSLQWLSTFLFGNESKYEYPTDERYTIYCDQVLGEDVHRPLQNVSEEEFYCPGREPAENIQVVIKAVSSMTAIIVIGVAFSFVVYRKRQLIRTLMYRYLGIRPVERPPGQHEDSYRYDIFISYDVLDLDFLTHTLRPKLEENRYQTYIHEINGLPGSAHVESIEEAMRASHRILVVLTQNYINSERCTEFEFNHALMHSMRERMDTLLIIQLQNQDLQDIPNNMIEYRKQRNWLHYDSENFLFWDKLFEQLPNPRQDLNPDPVNVAIHMEHLLTPNTDNAHLTENLV